MVRAIAIAVLWALAATCAQAGEFTCAKGDAADTNAVAKSPAAFERSCVRLRGMLSAVPKAGAMIAAAGRPGDGPPPHITVYFESDDSPGDLDKQPRFVEIVGRVLSCGDIAKATKESADRANEAEKKRPRVTGELEIVYLGIPTGTCHYRDDAFAILVSSYKRVPPPPG